MLLKIIELNH